MSESELKTATDSDEPGALTKAYRTVSPRYEGGINPEMDSIGWAMFLTLVVVFFPLLPFVALIWLISRGVGFITGQRGADEE